MGQGGILPVVQCVYSNYVFLDSGNSYRLGLVFGDVLGTLRGETELRLL